MKDAKDVEIQIGDIVAVAGRGGSSQWITTHEVVGTEHVQFGYGRPATERPVLVTERSRWNRKTQSHTTYKAFYAYKGTSRAILVIGKVTSAEAGK
jgi:hypothetical protein